MFTDVRGCGVRSALAVVAVLAVAGAASAASPRRTTDLDPQFSPQGDRIAYWHGVAGSSYSSLMTMRSDGTHARRLATGRYVGSFGWSPNGKLIAYSRNKEIYVVRTSGGRAWQVTTNANDAPDWVSFDGWDGNDVIEYSEGVCCTDGLPEEYQLTVDLRGRPPRVPGTECPVDECEVQPHGSRLAWSDGTTVYVSGARGEDEVALGSGCCPVWSPDGSRLTFSSGSGDARRVAIAHADGSGVTILPPPRSFGPEWAPDGSLLAFEADVDGVRQLWTANADGSDAHPVTHGPPVANSALPHFSAHGRWLVYGLEPAPRVLVAMVLRRDGTDGHELVRWRVRGDRYDTFYAGAFDLSWSPGDRAVVYHDLLPPQCAPTFAVFRADVATGRALRLTNVCRRR